MVSKRTIDGIEIYTAESDHLVFSITPALGGKITSVFNKSLNKEFLWTNKNLHLQVNEPGSDYDSNFYGGIDELIPNDMPETVGSISFPDHGELWTTALEYQEESGKISLSAKLLLSGLFYSKTVYASTNHPVINIDYAIRNESSERKDFLWKLHAALRIQEGDRLVSPARYAEVVDPEYSRFPKGGQFGWPFVDDQDASIVPVLNNTMDFFYLYDIAEGKMQLSGEGGAHLFSYHYDTKIFPYQWYFASYGGFLDHYTAILEPCTNMPMSINEARDKGQSCKLEPGESLTTSVQIYAGDKKGYEYWMLSNTNPAAGLRSKKM